ncbi:putative PHD type zinc finger protein with BAH domain-containing protein [Pleosporales sp. CAS-2024a]
MDHSSNGHGEDAHSEDHSLALSTRTQDDAPQSASNGTQTMDDSAPSKPASKASSSRNPTPAATSVDARSPAQDSNDASAPMETSQEPHDAAKLAKTAAHPSSKDSDENGAVPYGTRSRNRPGRSRPNYAEDTEMDFEMTAAAATNGTGSDPPSRSSVAAENVQTGGMSAKKGSVSAPSNASWGNAGSNSKDDPANPNLSGPSAVASTNPPTTAQPPLKRRKNAAATNGVHPSAAAPSQAGSKRGNHAMAAASSARESNMLTFENTGAMLKDGHMEADDGQTVSVNDQVYLVCEPPGEPYYLCRVMEFIHANNDPKQRVESLRVNWFYRPRDVQRYNNDSRLVYATMHSDLCPITSLRGKCQILHRSEVGDLDEYRKTKDSFWFNQVFDRFIHRWYDVIPTSQVINVPDKVKKALDERWKYICLETSRVKELTSAVKSCKRCVGFCASNDSVECAVCHNTYHMNCVRPPLLKKPSRGFAWACGPCSRAQEKKLEARRTPLLGAGGEELEEEEPLDEEEEEAGGETTANSPDPEGHVDSHPGTQAEIALAKMWPMRYLGIHARVEDALQYDDRAIYPRASSRLGPRHQANVNVWHGHPVELVKPAEIKKRYVKAAGNKKEGKLSKETVAAIEADKAEKAKRPKWVMDEPAGYVRRGEDFANKDARCTAELMFKMPPLGVHSTRGEDNALTVTEEQVKAYMERARALAKHVGVEPYHTNFLDRCLALFTKHQYDADVALKHVKKIDKRKDLKEPELSKEEEKKWNEGVSKYGSEIRSVRLHTSKNMFYGDAVRYYYMWKKTPKGREIWGAYSNRKGRSKRVEPDAQARLLDDVADNQDDSAFDNDKAMQRKRNFQCKYCNVRHSRQWRRAPGVSPGQTLPADGRSKDKTGFLIALCLRCANLWRKYAVKWENVDEIAKKVAQGGGKAWKRRIDEELLREVHAAQTDTSSKGDSPEYVDQPVATAHAPSEPPKKKQKTNMTAANGDSGTSTPVNDPTTKKKEKEKAPPAPKAPTPPPIPAPPRLKDLPCASTNPAMVWMNLAKQTSGIATLAETTRKKASLIDTEQEFYEQPKVTHKKKTDRDREKERMEKELIDKAKEEYRFRQQEKGRPLVPREPLKRTADNNWVHVYCALWHPEIRFSNAARLDMVEGIGAPTLRYDAMCKLCKTTKGACASCLHCHATFHVGCAHGSGYVFGFDMTPVKASRRDAVPTVTLNGDTGSMAAAIWCKEHAPKTLPHPMTEPVEGTDLTALQLFAREFKQADLTLTGTARKANLVDQSTRVVPQGAQIQTNRRASAITAQMPTAAARGRHSNAGLPVKEDSSEPPALKTERKCVRCKVEASPRWWKAEDQGSMVQPLTHVVDGPLPVNGTDLTPGKPIDQPIRTEDGQLPNGSTDHSMPDAPLIAPVARREQSKLDTNVGASPSISYLCQKCHWKKKNGIEDKEEQRGKPVLDLLESQHLALRSPPVQPFIPPPPPAMAGSWNVPNGPPPLPAGQPPPLPLWHNGALPAANHLPHHIHGAIGHVPPPHGAPLNAPPPFHAPYAPPMSGYPAYSGPSVLGPMPSALSRSAYAPGSNGAPPALHVNNGAMLLNGMHSPHAMPYSPTHTHGLPSSRSSESAYSGAPQGVAQYPGLHGRSPVPGRPATPRDTVMREAPVITSAPTERATTGASASPSLRNLLH